MSTLLKRLFCPSVFVRLRRLDLASAGFLNLVLVPCALAQPYWVDRVAGNPSVWVDRIPAKDAPLALPWGLAFDSSGNLYISDIGTHRVFRVDATGVITTVAGTGHQGFSGDGGPATNASLNFPWGIAVDANGNLYVADCRNHRIRKVDTAGTITTVAGQGEHGFAGDGGPAANATLACPHSIALDDAGNLYFSDSLNDRIRKIDSAGIITTIAGTGEDGFAGDGGPATNALLEWPAGIAFDGAGNLYITDSWNDRIRKVDTAGIITSVGDEIFSDVQDVAVDRDGNLLVAESRQIRKVDTAGAITTVASGGAASGDCGHSVGARLEPGGLAVDTAGRVHFSDLMSRTVRRLSGQRPIECSASPTPLSTWSVTPGQVSFAGFRSRGCLVPSSPQPQGQTFVVHSSEWQRMAPGETAWTTVDGTLRAGRLCAYSPTGPGEYRAVSELSVGSGVRRAYRSSNQIVGPPRADTGPSFGSAAIADQTYVVGTAISPLALPVAQGGDGAITYRLSPSVPGLAFNASTRQLAGTPATAGSYEMTYTARDANGDTAALRFTITVRSSGASAGSRRYSVDDVITTLPTGFWTPDVTSGGLLPVFCRHCDRAPEQRRAH